MRTVGSIARKYAVLSDDCETPRPPTTSLLESVVDALRDEPLHNAGRTPQATNVEIVQYIRRLLADSPSLSHSPVKQSDITRMSLPVVIVLGPRYEGKRMSRLALLTFVLLDLKQLCTNFVSKYKTSSVFSSLEHIYRNSSHSYDSLPSSDIINELLVLLKRLNVQNASRSCDGIIVTGFPRTVQDIDDLKAKFPELYEQLKVVLKGVLLVDYDEQLLRQIFSDEQLVSYQNTTLKVAEYYDELNLLSVIEGPKKLAARGSHSSETFHGLIAGYEMPLNQFAVVTLAIWSKERLARRHASETSGETIAQRRAYDQLNGLDSVELTFDDESVDIETNELDEKDDEVFSQ